LEPLLLLELNVIPSFLADIFTGVKYQDLIIKLILTYLKDGNNLDDKLQILLNFIQKD